MKSVLNITFILSVLLLGAAAYDLNKWELFTIQTVKMSFNRGRMARLYHPVLPTNDSIWRDQYYNSTTKDWWPTNPDTTVGQVWDKLMVGPNEEFAHDSLGRVYTRQRGANTAAWSRVGTFTCTDFAATTNYEVWFIESTTSGKLVRLFNRGSGVITKYTQKAEKIVVDSSHTPWIIRDDGTVAKLITNTFHSMPGSTASDIFIGTSTYIVSQEPATKGGFKIKKWNTVSSSWDTLDGIGGVSVGVGVGDTQEVFVITIEGEVYRQRGIPSTYCTGCASGWQTPSGASYEGFCKPDGAQCINCAPGTGYVDGSTLSCQACPELCETCSSSTVCTSCKPNYFLSPTGVCRGPCDGEAVNKFYYPKDGECRSTCQVPINNPNLNYQTCQLCPDYNCFECTIPKFCTLCYSSHFLSPVGHCMSECESPLVSSEPSPGDKRCKEPCGNYVYYDPGNDVCRA